MSTAAVNPVAQMSAGGWYPNEDCGEACDLSIGLRWGRNWPMRAIESQMPNPSAGTDAPSNVNFLNNNGVPSQRVPGSLVSRVANAQSRSHLAMSLVRSDVHGNPTPGGGYVHWVLNTGGAPDYQVMNPAYGQYMNYPNLPNCDFGDGLEIMAVAPCDQGGGPPVSVPQGNLWIARKTVFTPGTQNGYTMDGWGGLHPAGAQQSAIGNPYWPGWNIARDVAIAPDGSGGFVLDGWGGVHPFGTPGHAAPLFPGGAPYWPNYDVAVEIIVSSWSPGGVKGYTVDGWGGVHPWTGTPGVNIPGAYWPGGVA